MTEEDDAVRGQERRLVDSTTTSTRGEEAAAAAAAAAADVDVEVAHQDHKDENEFHHHDAVDDDDDDDIAEYKRLLASDATATCTRTAEHHHQKQQRRKHRRRYDGESGCGADKDDIEMPMSSEGAMKPYGWMSKKIFATLALAFLGFWATFYLPHCIIIPSAAAGKKEGKKTNAATTATTTTTATVIRGGDNNKSDNSTATATTATFIQGGDNNNNSDNSTATATTASSTLSASSSSSTTSIPESLLRLKPVPDNPHNFFWKLATRDNLECCKKAVLNAHKFGMVMERGLFHQDKDVETIWFSPYAFPEKIDVQEQGGGKVVPDDQYRHVMIVRNIYSALISGYQYHVTGMECWLGIHGEPLKNNNSEAHPAWAEVWYWEDYLTFHVDKNLSYPPRNGRSICAFLADETEEVGMRLFVDFALNAFYYGLISYWKEVQDRYRADGVEHTKVVCYEELNDPHTKRDAFFKVVNWLNPNKANSTYKNAPKAAAAGVEYHGSHSSSHDPVVKTRLRDILKKLDREVFDNVLSYIEQTFNCGIQEYEQGQHATHAAV